MAKEDYFTIFDRIDPNWAQKQAKEIFETMPCTQRGSNSGIFHSNYENWKFVRGSAVPLIKKFFDLIDENNDKFKHLYGRELNIHVCRLTYVRDASKEINVWHRDGHYLNGNTHLTIKGNCNLLIADDEECVTHLQVPNGTYFFFNATNYQHIIKPTVGERIEAVGFIDEFQKHIDMYYASAEKSPYKLCDNTHPAWREHQETIYNHYAKIADQPHVEGRPAPPDPVYWPLEDKNEDED